MKKYLLVFALFSCLSANLDAQIYGDTDTGTTEIDICNCTVGDPIPNAGFGGSSVAVAPNGNVYASIDLDVYYYDFASDDNVFVTTLPAEPVGLVYGPDGLLYATVTTSVPGEPDQLISINPVNGVVTVLGDMPLPWTMLGDLFFYQGELYGWFYDFPDGTDVFLVAINIADPASSTIVFTFPGTQWGGQIAAVSVIFNGEETVLVSAIDGVTQTSGIYIFDMNTGTYTLLCPGIIMADAGAPPGYEVPSCCGNFAGNFETLDLETACQNENITLNHLGDEVLTPSSALSFILMADSTGDLPDDILQISTTPTFSFDAATMVLEQIYFVAAVAAPGSAGAPDWSAGCLDVSFFAAVKWLGLPTVSFSIQNPEVCTGDCLDFEVNFTGEAPFNLTFENPISGQQSQTFLGENGVIQICPPAGSAAGDFNLSAVSLLDANCVCN